MERANEEFVAPAELTGEELDQVAGGVFRWIRAIAYSGVNTGDSSTSTNPQLWVTSAT